MIQTTKLMIAFGGIFFLVCCSASFPDENELLKVVDVLQNSQDSTQRQATLENFLSHLKATESVQDDQFIEKSLDEIFKIYLQKKDVAILGAFDNVRLEGGLANYVCTIYKRAFNDDVFIRRYQLVEHRSALQRCVGISFDATDLSLIFNK